MSETKEREIFSFVDQKVFLMSRIDLLQRMKKNMECKMRELDDQLSQTLRKLEELG